jgi:hypothetical protein
MLAPAGAGAVVATGTFTPAHALIVSERAAIGIVMVRIRICV